VKWFWIILALIYLISPYDIISGMHLPGWIDDIVVLGFLIRYLLRFRNTGASGTPSGNAGPSFQQESESQSGNTDVPERSPQEILGISHDADQQEIREAYRRLANQYHPDKVSHLGEEFHAMAEKRFKEIQQAYDALRR